MVHGLYQRDGIHDSIGTDIFLDPLPVDKICFLTTDSQYSTTFFLKYWKGDSEKGILN
jgi:hypothetical protein